jgi:dTDP-4-dehydrorhamnose reductase
MAGTGAYNFPKGRFSSISAWPGEHMIWLIGNRGMLGSDVEILLKRHSCAHLVSDIEIDITDYSALHNFAGRQNIGWIINCSAYTSVDAAETEAEKAFTINADGVKNIAMAAADVGASLVHISTDYVFDGNKSGPYTEEDSPNPIGVYGQSKLAGEWNITSVMNQYFILRTAWLYGPQGNNFVRTMLRLFREREEVRVVADQWGSPTFTKDLAAAIITIVTRSSSHYGIYNFTNEGRISWYDFSLEIYSLARRYGIIGHEVHIVPISTPEYPTRAKRPMNSYLSKEKIRRDLDIECRPWREALDECIRDMGY